MYQIQFRDNIIKTYPFKMQAIIWCYIHNFVSTGHKYTFLDGDIKIVEVNK